MSDKPQQSAGRRRKKRTWKDDLISLVLRVAVIILIVWAVFSFVFGLYVENGAGMEPSIQDRDIICYYRLDRDYRANEAVVYEADGSTRTGRVVAKGGDTVEITDEGLKVNGYAQQQYKDTGETLAAKGGPEYPLKLADDEVFILGDNREKSTDSRMFGAVKTSDVKGSILTVLRRRDI